jgi:hypothetical protein
MGQSPGAMQLVSHAPPREPDRPNSEADGGESISRGFVPGNLACPRAECVQRMNSRSSTIGRRGPKPGSHHPNPAARKKGSGGARIGAGRKRKEGRRDVGDRLLLNQKTGRCGCGRLMVHGSSQCVQCYRARTQGRRRTCIVCGAEFPPRSRHSKTCGIECGKERVRQVCAARRTSPESVRLQRRRACAMRRARLGKHSHKAGRWRRILARDGDACWLCRQAVDVTATAPYRLSPSVDHVVPVLFGGLDDDSNLRLAHFGCNSRRGAAKFTPETA